MLSPDLLARIDDRQVLAIAQVEQDPLTSTPRSWSWRAA